MLKSLRLKKNNRNAFMLLEVILSVFIVTIGVVFVIGSFITSIKTFKASKSYLDALYLVEEKMWKFQENGEIEEGSDSGEFEDYKDAEWNVEAKELEDEELPLNEVTLEIALKEDDRRRRFKVATYLFNKE